MFLDKADAFEQPDDDVLQKRVSALLLRAEATEVEGLILAAAAKPQKQERYRAAAAQKRRLEGNEKLSEAVHDAIHTVLDKAMLMK